MPSENRLAQRTSNIDILKDRPAEIGRSYRIKVLRNSSDSQSQRFTGNLHSFSHFQITFLLLCLNEETKQTKKLLDEEREQKREMYFRQSRMIYPDKEEWILSLAFNAFTQQEENGPL
jgi:hypothetical protein